MRGKSWLLDRIVAHDLARRHGRLRNALPDLTMRSPWCCKVSVTDAERGRVSVRPRRRRSVLILGGGPTHAVAPLDDPAYEVWCCNDLSAIAVDSERRFRADRWFELHPNDTCVRWRRRSDFWSWLATLPIPVYQFGRRDNTNSIDFPLQRVIRAGRDYFSCTFAYQIGLAIAEGFERIALYGADLLTAREATVERATVEWWLGFAEGQGIEIVMPQVYRGMVRTGNHPLRYAHPETCELEREGVYNWLRDKYQPTLKGFWVGNRPPRTLREWWAWRTS